MGDLEEIPYTPSIMSEIITVDSTNNLSISRLHQHPSNVNLPKLSIATVYAPKNIKGTGFIVGFHPKGPILLTCKHVAIDAFTKVNRCCGACFDDCQINYSISDKHICGVFFQLELVNTASSLFDQTQSAIDPITNAEYSVEFDAALYIVRNLCICGAIIALPPLTPLRLFENPSDLRKISVVGFMGQISDQSSPLKALSEQELIYLRANYHDGMLTESEGEVLALGELIAISSPTTQGFSGSPAICRGINGEIEVWGLFLGGPALTEHRTFISIANLYMNDQVLARSMLQQLASDICPMKNVILNNYIPFINGVKNEYNKTIYYASTSGHYKQSALNHNLCLPLSRIKGFLNHYGISLS